MQRKAAPADPEGRFPKSDPDPDPSRIIDTSVSGWGSAALGWGLRDRGLGRRGWDAIARTPTGSAANCANATPSGAKLVTRPQAIAKIVADLTADFTPADRFDAMALLQYLAIRVLRRTGVDPREFSRYAWHATIHVNRMSQEDLEREMRALSLTTSFGVAKHGKSRADHLFID